MPLWADGGRACYLGTFQTSGPGSGSLSPATGGCSHGFRGEKERGRGTRRERCFHRVRSEMEREFVERDRGETTKKIKRSKNRKETAYL